MQDKYTLITNINFINFNGMMLHCHALLIAESEGFIDRDKPDYRIRGFGTSSDWPVFQIIVPSPIYKAVDASSQGVSMLKDDGTLKPLSSGMIMKFEDGPELQVIVDDQAQPFDIEVFTGKDDRSILKVWEVLTGKVAKYAGGVNMPLLQWLPISTVRERVAAHG